MVIPITNKTTRHSGHAMKPALRGRLNGGSSPSNDERESGLSARFVHCTISEVLRVATLTGYFDASGKASSASAIELVVSGFVSTPKKWNQFEQQWQALLDQFELPYFHMKEFAPSTGVFKDWKGKEKRRRTFLQQLIDITVENTEQSIAAGVLLKDWRKANRFYELHEKDFPPYSLCGHTCVEEVYLWCEEKNYPRNQVLFMFEDGDEDKGALMRRTRKDFGIEVRFGLKKPDGSIPDELPMLPLQAADFAAWHTRRILDQLARDGSVPRSSVRYDFEELFSRIPYEPYHRHFSMTAATPTEARPGEFSILRRGLGIPSLVRFCVESCVPQRCS